MVNVNGFVKGLDKQAVVYYHGDGVQLINEAIE